MTPEENKKNIIEFVLAAFLGLAFLFMFSSSVTLLDNGEHVAETKNIAKPAIRIEPNPFTDISIIADSAIVVDTVSGEVLFAKNEEAQLPLASVTKVMTALIASEAPGETVVTIKKSDMQDGPGGLLAYEKWNLKDLINYTLVISSNSGSNAIAGAAGAFMKKPDDSKVADPETVFLQKMNDKAKEIGMNQTFYLNPSGLDVDVSNELSGAYGSARDMSKLFEYILKTKPELLNATAYGESNFVSLDGIKHKAENTNVIADTISGLMASKTGYTLLADGNLVVAFDVGPAHPVIVAVLGSTEEERFTDTQKLIDATIQKLGNIPRMEVR